MAWLNEDCNTLLQNESLFRSWTYSYCQVGHSRPFGIRVYKSAIFTLHVTPCLHLYLFLCLSWLFSSPLPTFHEWCTPHLSEFIIVLNTRSSSQMRHIYLVSFGPSSCQSREIEISGSQNIWWRFLLHFAIPWFRLSCISPSLALFIEIDHVDTQLVYLGNTFNCMNWAQDWSWPNF